MRIFAAIGAVVAAVIVAVMVFATLNLRALIGVHKDQLVARVAREIGRPITVEDVVASFWPLGVRLRRVAIGEDPAFGAAPFLVADGAVMAVRAWPLLHGRIEAAGVTLDHPRLLLVRNDDGRWNVASLGEPPATASEATGAGAGATRERRRGFSLPLEWVFGVALSHVHDGTIEVDDRKSGRAVVLRHVRLRAEDVYLGAHARIRVDAAAFADDAADVHLDLRLADLGQNDVEHAPFTATLEADDADLAMIAGWLQRAGSAAGRARRVVVEASGTASRFRAEVELDAVDPDLRVGSVPLGAVRPLALHASVARDGPTVAIEELRGTLGTLVVEGQGKAGLDPWRVALEVASPRGTLMLRAGETPVAITRCGGTLRFEREGLELTPFHLDLDGVPLEMRGWVTGLAPVALDVRLEGRPFDGLVAADVALDANGAARVRAEATAVQLAPALDRLAPDLRGRIAGTASGAVVLTGRVADAALVPGSLAGTGTITVTDGRLRDVNLPDLVVAEIERVPLMPQLVSARTRARYAELFGGPDTVVEAASVPFTIARGRLSTERAMLDNPAYQVTAKGWINEAHELRLSGTVLLGASVSRTLRDDVRAAKYLAADDGRISLPFVARGPLGRVRVEPDGKRLRERGLTALLGESKDDGERAPREEGRRERRHREPLEDEVIERLERMIKP